MSLIPESGRVRGALPAREDASSDKDGQSDEAASEDGDNRSEKSEPSFGVPVQTVDKVIKVMSRVKIPIYIVFVLILLARRS